MRWAAGMRTGKHWTGESVSFSAMMKLVRPFSLPICENQSLQNSAIWYFEVSSAIRFEHWIVPILKFAGH